MQPEVGLVILLGLAAFIGLQFKRFMTGKGNYSDFKKAQDVAKKIMEGAASEVAKDSLEDLVDKSNQRYKSSGTKSDNSSKE